MSERATNRVDWRVSLTAATGMVVGVSMILLGMEPRLFLIGVIIVALAAAAWLVIDVGDATSPVVWRNSGSGTATAARSDHRVQILRARLRRPARWRRATPVTIADQPEPVDEVVASLLDAIDDHLIAEHGIDRSIDPDAASDALGPELDRFARDPSARRSMTGRRGLARTLTLIEDL